MSPDGGGLPGATVSRALEKHFGSVDDFRRELANAAETEFGSGWAWVVRTADGKLKIMKTTDAENPLRDGLRALLTIDVWEHAYYLDYRNERARYVSSFLDHLINWQALEDGIDG